MPDSIFIEHAWTVTCLEETKTFWKSKTKSQAARPHNNYKSSPHRQAREIYIIHPKKIMKKNGDHSTCRALMNIHRKCWWIWNSITGYSSYIEKSSVETFLSADTLDKSAGNHEQKHSGKHGMHAAHLDSSHYFRIETKSKQVSVIVITTLINSVIEQCQSVGWGCRIWKECCHDDSALNPEKLPTFYWLTQSNFFNFHPAGV